MIYYKANRNRKKEYSTYIKILEDGRVCKGALVPEALQHIQNIYENARMLSGISSHFDLHYTYENEKVYCELAKGKSLSEYLVADLTNHHLEDFDSKIRWFIQELDVLLPDCEYEAKGIFSEFPRVEGKYTDLANLDFNFDNIFVDENDYKVIDCEWCFNTCIPKQFILYRSLLYFYTKYASLMEETLEDFFNRYGIREIEQYSKMEEVFQSMVYGSQRELNYLENYFAANQPRFVEGKFGQIYYDAGRGLNEQDSIRYDINLNSMEVEINYSLHQSVGILRVDVVNEPCLINHLTIRVNDEIVAYNSTNGYEFLGKILFLDSDPQIIIQADQRVENISISYEIEEIYSQDLRFVRINEFLEPIIHRENHIIEAKDQDIIKLIAEKEQITNDLNYIKEHPLKFFLHKIKCKIRHQSY